MIFYIWLGVWFALLIVASILQSKMLKCHIPGRPLPRVGWRRGFTILTDPDSFTRMGESYRLWTIRLEVTAMLWAFPGVIIAITLNDR